MRLRGHMYRTFPGELGLSNAPAADLFQKKKKKKKSSSDFALTDAVSCSFPEQAGADEAGIQTTNEQLTHLGGIC